LDNYTIYATTCFSFISAFNFDNVKISLIFNKTHALDWIIIQYMIEIAFKTAALRLFLRVILICHTYMPAACIACFEILQSESSVNLKILFT
jgi:hypothetical protein